MSIDSMVMMIPILAVTLGLGAVITLIVSRHRRDLHELEHRHRERMAAIDKGLELPPEAPPPEVVPERTSRRDHPRYLLRGLVWLGIGLAIALQETHRTGFNSFGWIAVAIGAAYLIFYLVEGRTSTSARGGGPPSAAPGKTQSQAGEKPGDGTIP